MTGEIDLTSDRILELFIAISLSLLLSQNLASRNFNFRVEWKIYLSWKSFAIFKIPPKSRKVKERFKIKVIAVKQTTRKCGIGNFRPEMERILGTRDIIPSIEARGLDSTRDTFLVRIHSRAIKSVGKNFNGLNTVWKKFARLISCAVSSTGGEDLLYNLPFRLPSAVPFIFLSIFYSPLARNHPFRRGLINRSVVYSITDHDRYDPREKFQSCFTTPLTRPICGIRWTKVDEF